MVKTHDDEEYGHLVPIELMDELIERYANEHGYRVLPVHPEGGSSLTKERNFDFADNRAMGQPSPGKRAQDRVLTTAPQKKSRGILRRLARLVAKPKR